MTYLEAEVYYDFYTKRESDKTLDLMKLFAFYNVNSTLVATRGKSGDISAYINSLKREVVSDNSIEDQFEEKNLV